MILKLKKIKKTNLYQIELPRIKYNPKAGQCRGCKFWTSGDDDCTKVIIKEGLRLVDLCCKYSYSITESSECTWIYRVENIMYVKEKEQDTRGDMV